MRQPGIVGAEVWEAKGTLLARAYVSEESWLCENDLRQACFAELGADLTPGMILLERCRRKAA